MSKKILTVLVKGTNKEWSFEFKGNPKHLPTWRDDGLEVYELVNSIPEWVANLGLTKPWCFFQDIINFKWPF